MKRYFHVLVGLAVAGFGASQESTADDAKQLQGTWDLVSLERDGKEVKPQKDTRAMTGKLDGTLDLPEGEGPFPVVISIAGSGPIDRDGNWPGVKLDYLKHLGHASAQSDHQRIQGSWHFVTLSTGPGKEDHIVFSGDKISWHVGKTTLKGTFVIDATKQPKRIDLKFTEEKKAPAVLLGIYDFKGELLAICIRGPGGLRPTKLEGGKEQTLVLFYRSMQGTKPETKK